MDRAEDRVDRVVRGVAFANFREPSLDLLQGLVTFFEECLFELV
jgi:hypothetical protein